MGADSEGGYETVYRTAMPSVVSIYVHHWDDERRRRAAGAGSGFVYDADGHVVTNQHVVGDATEVDLRFSEGDWRVGRVVGVDAYTDLAVVRVDDLPDYATPLPVAETAPRPGQPVAALGNPLGLDGTISAGIVSGTNRSMPTGQGFAIPDTVQTDAPINPGNSGGPLVTLDGVVVGVNRATAGENIGFAVSPLLLRRVVPRLIADRRVAHPYMRIRTIDVSPTVAEANGLDEPRGVLVVDAWYGPTGTALAPSDRTARIRGQEVPVGGDIIVGIEGTPIDSHEALVRYLITEAEPGATVELSVVRGGRETTERVRLEERPDPDASGSDRRRRLRGR
jgi:S1-C subfamily serine protease